MFTPYNIAVPTVLYPLREVPLFTHQPAQPPPHQNEPQHDPDTASNKPPASEQDRKSTNDNNEWSTVDLAPSTTSSTTPRHGWLHLPHPHFPHPHIDLSIFRHEKVAVPTLSQTTDSSAPKQAHQTHHLPYLPASPLWPTHLYSSTSPFHHPSTTSQAHTNATSTNPTTNPHNPPASVTRLPKSYVLELDAPGFPSTSSSDTTPTTTLSVTWLSPRTILVAGRTPAAQFPLDDAQDGGELCRTPTREDPPAGPAFVGADGSGGDGKEGEEVGGKGEEGVSVLFSERSLGEWRRSFTLPSDAVVGVDPSGEVGGEGGLRWEVEDGVVRVWVPRA